MAHQRQQIGGDREAEGGLDPGDQRVVGGRAVAEVEERVLVVLEVDAARLDRRLEAIEVADERLTEIGEGEELLAGGDQLGVRRIGAEVGVGDRLARHPVGAGAEEPGPDLVLLDPWELAADVEAIAF
ncbi:MAG: hypothetical protein H6710_01895 [Myxococcales bacterium]|nr:hypothetical protein [Myxococcales bacterium]